MFKAVRDARSCERDRDGGSARVRTGANTELAAAARSRDRAESAGRRARREPAAGFGAAGRALGAFQKANGLDMVQASYRDFNPAIVDLGEGRIDALASGVAPLLAQARAGKIRLLAFINRERSPAVPDVPTAAEAGYPQITFSAITGLFRSREMPDALRERIAADVRAITAEPAIKERLPKKGS